MPMFWVFLAFLTLFGIALLFACATKGTIAEGMLFGAATVTFLMFAGQKVGSYRYGAYAACVLSTVGIAWTVATAVFGKRQLGKMLFSPYAIVLWVVFLYCMIAYNGDFVQHIDELHQWAFSVKYMLREDLPPTHSLLYDHRHPYGTSLFHLFFQMFSGYREDVMYVSAGVLSWVGFLLPFSETDRWHWKRVAAYCLILYVALFSIYYYGMKNLYVDLPVIAWSGGLAGWWRVRTKRKRNLLVVVSGLLAICSFKWMAGPLMALLTALFLAWHTLVLERGALSVGHRKHTIVGITLVGVCGIVAFAGVVAWKWPVLFANWTQEKQLRTIGMFLTSVAGRPLAPDSALKVAPLPFLAAILALVYVTAGLARKRVAFYAYATYAVVAALLYGCMLLFAYLFFFGYEESVKLAGGPRYLALLTDFLFVFALAFFLQETGAGSQRAQRYVALGMFLVFLSGVNQKFVPTMTAFDPMRTPGYADITETKRQAAQIQERVGSADRIYLIEQGGKNEYVTNTAFYVFEEQVSNYLTSPWRFNKRGSTVRLEDVEV